MGLIKQYILPQGNSFIPIGSDNSCHIAISTQEREFMDKSFYFSETNNPQDDKKIFLGKTGRYDFDYTLSSIENLYFFNTPLNTTIIVAYN